MTLNDRERIAMILEGRLPPHSRLFVNPRITVNRPHDIVIHTLKTGRWDLEVYAITKGKKTRGWTAWKPLDFRHLSQRGEVETGRGWHKRLAAQVLKAVTP